MWSKNALKHIRTTVKNVHFLGSLRFGWEEAQDLIKVPSSSWRKFLVALNVSVNAAYVLYLLARYVHLKYFERSDTAPAETKLIMEYFLIAHLMPLVCCHLMVFSREETIAGFYKQFLRYYANLEVDNGVSLKLRDQILTQLILSGRIVQGVHISLAFLFPNLPIFPSSLHSAPLVPWERVVHGVMMAYIVSTWWYNMLFMAVFFVTYVFTTWSAVEGVRSSKRPLKERAKDYRCLQVLQSRANEIMQLLLASVKALLLPMTIRSIYGALTETGPIRMMYGNNSVTGVLFLVLTFRALGKVYQKSQEFLHMCKAGAGNPWFRRFYRSSWPLKFQVGGLYYADPGMSLTLGSFAVESTASMLIYGSRNSS